MTYYVKDFLIIGQNGCKSAYLHYGLIISKLSGNWHLNTFTYV